MVIGTSLHTHDRVTRYQVLSLIYSIFSFFTWHLAIIKTFESSVGYRMYMFCDHCNSTKCVQWAVLFGSIEYLAGHHSSCLCYIGPIDVKIFVVRAGWCPQLTTNIVKFYLFINAHVPNPSIMTTGSSMKLYVYSYSRATCRHFACW